MKFCSCSVAFLTVFETNVKSKLTYLNCTDNYDVAKIKMKSVTDH